MLRSNEAFVEALSTVAMPTQHFFTFPSSVPGMPPIQAYALLPPGFNSDWLTDCRGSPSAYPVLMYVYGGPGSQQVTRNVLSSGSLGWHLYLASTHRMVVVVMDGIGTSGAQVIQL